MHIWICWQFPVWLMSVWSAFIVSYVKRSIRSLNEHFLGKWSVFTRASYFYFAHLLRLSLMHLWKLLHHFSITILFEVFYCLLMLPMHSLVQNSFNLDSNKVWFSNVSFSVSCPTSFCFDCFSSTFHNSYSTWKSLKFLYMSWFCL